MMGYFTVIIIVGAVCLLTYYVRKKMKIGTYTKEEIDNMKSNLDLLLQEETIEEKQKDETD